MALPLSTCQNFVNYLGRRPYNWDRKIAKDRKPYQFLYASMYKTSPWPNFTGTTHLWQKVHVARPNATGLWSQFSTETPCVGAPCDQPRKGIGYGTTDYRYEKYRDTYMTEPFCLDQLDTVEAAVEKMAAIAKGLKKVPEDIISSFLRTYVLRRAGSPSTSSGLFLAGAKNTAGNPLAIAMDDSMFAESQGESLVHSTGTLLINLNKNGDLTAQSITTTAGLKAAMGKLTMEYLRNAQIPLSANGYNDTEFMPAGKFTITVDPETKADLSNANPALTDMYKSADFQKGGAFYSLGATGGAGDWLFKDDNSQLRFRFRGDMDGKDFAGGSVANAVWIESVVQYDNVATTYGLMPVLSNEWLIAPIRMYHAFNRAAREVFVGDVTSVNDEMKFGLARSLMGDWKWYSPDYFKWTNPCTGQVCEFNNDTKSKGYWLAEFEFGMKNEFPEIERVILGLGEQTPFLRVPTTVTPASYPVAAAYQSILPYNCACPEDFSYAEIPED